MPDESGHTPEVRRFSACTTKDCKAPPSYRYTVGDDEVAICAVHGAGLAVIAQKTGAHLHLIPLHENEIGTPGDDPTTDEGDSDAQVSEGDAAG